MEKPLFLFAPGAGAPSTSAWMEAWAVRLATLGRVERFDYGYMKEGKKRPDPHDRLVATHKDALARARANHTGKVVLIGKSMGSRMGCHVSLSEPVDLLVCFGYPLVAAHGGKLRDQVLLELTTSILFVQGTRDTLCPLDKLATVREKMRASNQLHVVNEGDHSLLVTKRELKAHGETQEDVDARILNVIRDALPKA